MNSFYLKIIAMITMFLDHFIKCFFLTNELKYLYYFGRISYPIYAFLLVEGYFHTKNLKKYYIRLFLLAIVSEIPYDYFFTLEFFNFEIQNVIWELLLGLIIVHLLDRFKKFTIPIIIVSFYLANFLNLDYYGYGILIILIFYYAKKMRNKIIFEAPLLLIISILSKITLEWFNIFSLIPINLYNGKLGYTSKIYFIFTYLFYPLHIILLIYLRYLIYKI